jgi:hypothetical protein
MLAEMLQLCPCGQENSWFFDHTDRRVLPGKADQLWAHYYRQSHDMVAVVDEPNTGRLVHVLDRISKKTFLCDTRVFFHCDLLNCHLTSPHRPWEPTHCQLGREGAFCNGVTFAWASLLADVQFQILGVDF